MSRESRPKTVMNQGAGGDHHPLGEVRVEDAEGTEVLGAAGDDLLEPGVVGLHLGHLAPPLGEPLAGCGLLDRATAPVLRVDGDAVDDRADLETGGPPTPGGDDDVVGDEPRDRGRGPGSTDLDAPGHGPPPVGEKERAGPVPPAPDHLGTDLTTVGLGARPPLLHREQVGEVGVDDDLDPAGGGLVGEVAHGELLPHALPDVTAAKDHEGRVGPARGR